MLVKAHIDIGTIVKSLVLCPLDKGNNLVTR